MTCPKCNAPQPEGAIECGRCGIVFRKYLAPQHGRETVGDAVAEEVGRDESGKAASMSVINELLFHTDPHTNILNVFVRAVLLIFLIIWGMKFITSPLSANYAGHSFMHFVNLPFHEAGHLIFSPLGRFMAVLGGSLLQLLVPLVCLTAFILKTRDPFAASVALWWLGESMIDLAPYINDARQLRLMLLGGVTGRDVPGYHDWHYLLSSLGCLECDRYISYAAHASGVVLIVLSFAWGGLILYRQMRGALSADI